SHAAHDSACGAAVTQLQRAGTDHGATCVGVVGSEDRGAGPGLGQVSTTGDQVRERDDVTAIESQRSVITDIPWNTACCTAIAELQRRQMKMPHESLNFAAQFRNLG